MRRFAPISLLLLCALAAQAQETGLLPPAAAKPGEEPVTISADRLEGYANQRASASGNAELRQGNLSVRADRLTYIYSSDEVQASGNVQLSRDGDRLSGTGLRLRVRDYVGQFDRADYQLTRPGRAGAAPLSARGRADVIKFEGEGKYHLQNATLTTCKPGNNDWYMQVGALDLDMTRDLGVARRGKLVFKDTTIAYVPWVDFPLQSQRKTGFLPPTIGSSGKSGFEITLPYFINLAPNRDVTIAPRELSKRGLQLNTEFRYLERSYDGQVRVEYLPNDRLRNINRYAATIQHRQAFSDKLSGYLNVNKVSDDNYFRDLSSRINMTSQTTLPRDGILKYDSGWWTASARVQRFQTLQDPSNPVVPPYDRLPQLTLNALRQQIGGVDLSWNSEFVRFDRSSGFSNSYGAATIGGIDTSNVVGSRFVAYPSASLPLMLPGAYLTPKLGFHVTDYSLERNPAGIPASIQRSLPIASVDSGLIFERDASFFGNAVRQTLEPRLYYLYVPYRDQSRIPLFDTSLADFNYAQIFSENLYNGGDRIADANELTVAASTRFISPSSGRELFKATIGQRLYFDSQRVALNDATPVRSDKTSDLLAGLSGRVARDWTLDSALQYNPHRSYFQRVDMGLHYRPETAKVLNLGYRFTRDALSQVDVSAQWPLGGGWYGVGRYNYSFRDNRLIEALGGFEYNAGCWIGRVVLQRFAAAAGTSTSALFVQLELNGLSGIGSNPLETLQRNIPGYGVINQRRPGSPSDY